MEIHTSTDWPKFFFGADAWHNGQSYTDVATLEPGFLYVVLREIVPGSTNKMLEQQVAMLPEGYEPPSTIIEVTKDILDFRKTGKQDNRECLATCSDRTTATQYINAGYISCVGLFGLKWITVGCWQGLSGRDDVGIGAFKKVPLVV